VQRQLELRAKLFPMETPLVGGSAEAAGAPAMLFPTETPLAGGSAEAGGAPCKAVPNGNPPCWR